MELQVLKSNRYIFLLKIEMKSNGLSCTTAGIIFGYGVAGYRYYSSNEITKNQESIWKSLLKFNNHSEKYFSFAMQW